MAVPVCLAGRPPGTLDDVDPHYPPEAEEYREKVRAFLGEHLPSDWKGIGALDHEAARRFTTEWRATLHQQGLLAPSWPKKYGGAGLTPLEQVIVAEEFYRAGVPTGGPNDDFSIQMVGNTILHWGTEEQKNYFLPRALSGEHVWCQGYSEPGAGSDLANLGTRAVLDGDEWVINGQKIWTSMAHVANWIFVLARTDPEATKHKGITFLLVPMDQPGVEVRPIRMMTGWSEFNETFFTDARTARENVVGAVNAGWSVAMTLLGYERGEAAASFPIMFRAELDRLLELARSNGASKDPRIRQRLAWCYSKVEIMRYLGMRTLTKFLAGGEPGPAESSFKLYWSEYHKVVTELAVDILGPAATTPTGRAATAFRADDVGAPNDSASWATTFLMSRAGTIYAGSSQVQRNILGEMVLGLPKEPAPAAQKGSWREAQAGL
jgi:alkylation response protein AidB-like acyl-CoA dehydrogenase